MAVILPAPQEVVASVEGMESDPEVERIAVDVVMKYEVDHDRKPVSVEEENCGWDVTSLYGGQVARYIEIKGRAGEGGVALTPNEWIKAQRFGQEYWLYIVVNCKSNPQLYLIQDPASKLHPKEEVSVVRYMVGQRDWKQAADRPYRCTSTEPMESACKHNGRNPCRRSADFWASSLRCITEITDRRIFTPNTAAMKLLSLLRMVL